MITRTADSHVDHGLTEAQLDYVLEHAGDGEGFRIRQVELPPELGTAPCALHGPIMGDEPIDEAEVTYATRGDRKGESRLVTRPARRTATVTVIAGPHEGDPLVLYTAFGGPPTPREPFDAPPEAFAESSVFWAQHALSR